MHQPDSRIRSSFCNGIFVHWERVKYNSSKVESKTSDFTSTMERPGRITVSIFITSKGQTASHWLVEPTKEPRLQSKQKNQNLGRGGFAVAQWMGVCLPVQGTWVQALVQEDPTCCRAARPMHHNYWACALGPVRHNCWAHMPQLLKPTCLEPVLCNGRSHHNERPAHRNKE